MIEKQGLNIRIRSGIFAKLVLPIEAGYKKANGTLCYVSTFIESPVPKNKQ